MTLLEEDILLANACKKMQRSAQQFLYQKYAKLLYSIAFRYLNDKDEAKDLLHDAFVKIFDKIQLYKGNGSLEGWLKRIMVNECISFLRSKRKIQMSLLTEEISESEFIKTEEYSSYELDCYTKKDVLNCLQNLSEDYRIVFQLFALDNFSHKEIAEQIGILENASRARYFRAKKQLRDQLLALNKTKHEE